MLSFCYSRRFTNMYGRRKYYVSMRSSFCANFARSSYKVEARFVWSCAVVLTKSGQSSYQVEANFVRSWGKVRMSWGEVHTKLRRSSYDVDENFVRSWGEVCMKLWSSSYKVRAISFGLSFSTNVAMVRTCYALMSLWKWRVDRSIASVMASYSE